jgi:hypothetical protein
MYRRVILIAVLPLIGSNDVALQATAACLFSLIFIVVSSELSPFRRDITNFFNIVAQYQVNTCRLNILIFYFDRKLDFGCRYSLPFFRQWF